MTVYVMRISVWSSDVCSSDLHRCAIDPSVEAIITAPSQGSCCRICSHNKALIWSGVALSGGASGAGPKSAAATPGKKKKRPARTPVRGRCARRSEEHTSELQSLMRISYAVVCLKKKYNKGNIEQMQ